MQVLPEGGASEARRRLPDRGRWGAPSREKRQGRGWGLVAGTAEGCASGFSLEEVHTDVQEEGAEAGFVVLLGIRVTLSLDWEQGWGADMASPLKSLHCLSGALLKQENGAGGGRWVGMGSLRPNGL